MQILPILKFKTANVIKKPSFLLLVVGYFLLLNLIVLFNSGLLSQGGHTFNTDIKYELLTNNFALISLLYGIILAAYLGNQFLKNDIDSRQLYIILISFPNRVLYLSYYLIWALIVVLINIILTNINYLLMCYAFEVKPYLVDLVVFNRDLLMNIVTVMVVSILGSLVIKKTGGVIVIVLAVILFNIYTNEFIPVINLHIGLTKIVKDIMAMIFPLKMIYLSYIDSTIKQRAIVNPFGIDINLYQLFYMSFILIISSRIFNQKDL